ncbi:MAG TPA: thioredoxin domain-containing protein [Chromatiales bacterium]|nr:thioredoxin domain-containing protein [Thiotrichales bacterium]HIP67838.1 thioredoxin domain-containing protein [Chromatiales bacterium]
MPPNQLINETSPYLQQHADNPVDWHPWNAESLTLAKRLNKPILLSVGYSACHWCHVMAHESFEDEATAALMNDLFINIKVDREERPDLDKIYQTAHYMLTQRNGGWPLTMFLTPNDQIPFFGGTYFPREAHYGLPSFKDLLRQIADAYTQRKNDIINQNQSILSSLNAVFSSPGQSILPNGNILERACRNLSTSFDQSHGGFGQAPKFPHPTNIEILLRYSLLESSPESEAKQAMHMAEFSLEKMAHGGMYDQIGGGFCRYSVDDLWMIPHFEKMLYDNGPLLALYTQVFALTGSPLFKRIAVETADWVMAEMQSPEGGYYSSLDADSEGEEGKFYVWTPDEVKALLTEEEFPVFAHRYGLDRQANFEGQWHLHVSTDTEELSRKFNLEKPQVETLLNSARTKLYNQRKKRIWPGRDEKILVSWNALMIKGMAQAAQHLDNDQYANSANRAVEFIFKTLWKDGRLLATYKDGKSHLNAYLDDYAFLLDALIELLQLKWNSQLLTWAEQIAEILLNQFEDKEQGGFFFTSHDHEQLIQRPKSLADEAMPSGYGVATLALQRLGWLLGESRYLEAAERSLKAAASAMQQSPSAYGSLLGAYDEYLNPASLIILRGNINELSRWKNEMRKQYSPQRMCFAIPEDTVNLPASLASKKPQGDCVAYLCSGTSCSNSITEFKTFQKRLSKISTE